MKGRCLGAGDSLRGRPDRKKPRPLGGEPHYRRFTPTLLIRRPKKRPTTSPVAPAINPPTVPACAAPIVAIPPAWVAACVAIAPAWVAACVAISPAWVAACTAWAVFRSLTSCLSSCISVLTLDSILFFLSSCISVLTLPYLRPSSSAIGSYTHVPGQYPYHYPIKVSRHADQSKYLVGIGRFISLKSRPWILCFLLEKGCLEESCRSRGHDAQHVQSERQASRIECNRSALEVSGCQGHLNPALLWQTAESERVNLAEAMEIGKS